MAAGELNEVVHGHAEDNGVSGKKLINEARTYGHGRGAPGMNTILRVYPESIQSVTVLCNLDHPSASRMRDCLQARMHSSSSHNRRCSGGKICHTKVWFGTRRDHPQFRS